MVQEKRKYSKKEEEKEKSLEGIDRYESQESQFHVSIQIS